jgi:hypothetical protein
LPAKKISTDSAAAKLESWALKVLAGTPELGVSIMVGGASTVKLALAESVLLEPWAVTVTGPAVAVAGTWTLATLQVPVVPVTQLAPVAWPPKRMLTVSPGKKPAPLTLKVEPGVPEEGDKAIVGVIVKVAKAEPDVASAATV